MLVKDFGAIDDLERLVKQAIDELSASRRAHNFLVQATFDKKIVFSDQLLSCNELAEKWQSVDIPKEFYFNHGHYIGADGINHIIRELKHKPTSNRALYSLIDEDDIVGTLDKPIPSFMVLQCAIEGSTLLCSTYFRALEVSVFLKINVAEIKLVLSQILREFPDIKTVNLSIIAFTAYIKEDFNPLQRPKLDWLEKEDLPEWLMERPKELGRLLEEKAKPSSVVEVNSLISLLRIIENNAYKNDRNNYLKRDRIKSLLADAIKKGGDLHDLRKRHSSHEEIDAVETEYSDILKLIAKEFIVS